MVFIWSCQANETTREINNQEYKNLSLLNGEEIPEGEPLFSDLEIIPLETNDDILMAGCNRIEFFEEKFFVLDQQFSNLLAFNRQGRYLYRIGSLGSGPGEYRSIYGFDIDEKNREILVYSLDNQSILRYNLEGEFLDQERIDFYGFDFSLANNGNYVFNLRYNDNGEYSRHNVFVVDGNGKLKSQFFPYPKEATQVVLSRSGFMLLDGNVGYYNNAFSDTLYQFDIENKTTKPLMSLSLGTKSWKGGYNFMKIFQDNFVEYNYLSSTAFVNKDLLFVVYLESEIFKGQSKPGLTPKVAIVNMQSGKIINSESSKNEILMKYGIAVPKGRMTNDTYITSIGANGLGLIQKNYPETWTKTKSLYPDFYEEIKEIKEENNPTLVVYKINR